LAILSLLSLCARSKRTRKLALFSLLPVYGFSCTTSTEPDLSSSVDSISGGDKPEWEYHEPTKLKRSLYAAAGVGASTLEPDTHELVNHEVKDSVNLAGQLSLGVDFSKHVAAELHAASLDQADISPSGNIEYKHVGTSALLYVGKSKHKYRRQGFSAYGRLGFGTFINEPSSEIPQIKRHQNHVLFGLGAEYMLNNGLGFRSEIISFDEDAQFAQLAMVYRFENKDRRRVIPPIAKALPDIDNDGVVDIEDDCDSTKPNYSVNRNGCAHFDGIIEGVEFEFDKATLTVNAKYTLDAVIQTLLEYPEANLNIGAHTDNIASVSYNVALSKRRARSVASYLALGGIALHRLSATGYGESQPIAPNMTSDGRQRNRRVELHSVLQQ